MKATLRALVSLLALLGFYVIAVALIGGVIYGAFMARDVLPGMYWVIGITAAAGLVVLFSLVTLATWRPGLAPGIDVSAEQAPELWALVADLAATTRTRGPERIRLVGTVNASVSEDARFFGLFGGPRNMYLGVPLLQGLTVSQLRAVLAHEFGHFSGMHTRLGPVAYRGWQAIVNTVQQLQGNIFQWPLRFYMAVYMLLSMGMSRSQEREADRLMVQVGGRANAQAALREVQVLTALWTFYNDNYLGLGWGSDLAPTAEGFFGGFDKLRVALADRMEALRAKVPNQPPTDQTRQELAAAMLDSHPPIGERIAAMESMPEPTQTRSPDDRYASALIPDFDSSAAETAELAYVFGHRDRVDWDDIVGRAFTYQDQSWANRAYEAAGQFTKESSDSLAAVVALSEAGQAVKLVRAAYPDHAHDDLDETVRNTFSALVRAAAVQAGVARWRVSWSDIGELVTADDEVLDDESIGALLADADTAADGAARLRAAGIDLAAVGTVSMPMTVNYGQVLGGIANMKSDGPDYDVLILSTGLLLAQAPDGETDSGQARLRTLQLSGSLASLVARHRFVPYASMSKVRVSGTVVPKASIELEDGATLRLRSRLSSESLGAKDDDLFKQMLKRIP